MTSLGVRGSAGSANRASFGLVVALVLAALLPARAQEPAPRIVFSPELNVAQVFRVTYSLRDVPAANKNWISVVYRLTVTPIAREKDGYRLRLLVSDIERPAASTE